MIISSRCPLGGCPVGSSKILLVPLHASWHFHFEGFIGLIPNKRTRWIPRCCKLPIAYPMFQELLLSHCKNALLINSVQTRGVVKTSGFTGVLVKIADFIEFKRFLLEILENKPSSENQKTQKIARKVDFSEPRLLQCT